MLRLPIGMLGITRKIQNKVNCASTQKMRLIVNPCNDLEWLNLGREVYLISFVIIEKLKDR